MINKIFLLIAITALASCNSREKLNNSSNIRYVNKDVFVEIKLMEKKKIKINNEDKFFYYGTMSYSLLSDRKPNEIWIVYKDKKSEVYLDTTVDYVNFWDRKKWDSNGLRNEKIYVSFPNNDIDFSEAKILERENLHDIKSFCFNRKTKSCNLFNKTN